MEVVSAPSVITSEVYNQAEAIFNLLQNKEKLVSFLDCTTLLRGMGMNPTHSDMDCLKERMSEPILKLEQWRREEELRREKERRKEEARDKKRNRGTSVSSKGGAAGRKSLAEKAAEGEEKPVKIVPVEEIKNIDWNIFIGCTEEIFRDTAVEEKVVLAAVRTFHEEGESPVMTRDRLIEIVTSNGDNVLTPAEVKQLVAILPEDCTYEELAARIQGTYVPPTKEDLDRIAAQAVEEKRQREEAEKAAAAAADDPLTGL